MSGGRKTAHVEADLGDDHLTTQVTDARNALRRAAGVCQSAGSGSTQNSHFRPITIVQRPSGRSLKRSFASEGRRRLVALSSCSPPPSVAR